MHWFHVNCINSYLKDGIKRIRCSNGEDTKEHEHQEPLLNHYVKTINNAQFFVNTFLCLPTVIFNKVPHKHLNTSKAFITLIFTLRTLMILQCFCKSIFIFDVCNC